MHPRLASIVEHLTRQRAELRTAVESIPIEVRTVRPAPGRWSAAEVLEHLGLVEVRVTGLIEQHVADARARGIGPELDTTPFPIAEQHTLVTDRSNVLESPDATKGSSDVTAKAAWNRMRDSRAKLLRVVADADGLALDAITAPHRIFGEYNIYQWLVFIGSHEARHAAQIREIGAQLAGRPG